MHICGLLWSQDTLVFAKVAFSESKIEPEETSLKMPCLCRHDLIHFIRNLLCLGRTIEPTVSPPRQAPLWALEESLRPWDCSSVKVTRKKMFPRAGIHCLRVLSSFSLISFQEYGKERG